MAYEVIGMLRDGGLQKDLNDYIYAVGTPYLSAQERAEYEVDVHGGKLRFHKSCKIVDTSDGYGSVYLFIMTGEGAIFMAPAEKVHHHSSFASGNPVAAAGTIQVSEGTILLMTSDSGHYQPPKEFLEQFVRELKKRSTDLSKAESKFGRTKSENKHARVLTLGNNKVDDVTTLTLTSGNHVLLDKGSHYSGQSLRIYPEGLKWKWY